MQVNHWLADRLARLKWPLLLLAALSATLFGGWYAWRSYYLPSTDDAYLNANVVRIAAQIGGPVKRVEVVDQQRVEAGALLFEIDPAPFQIALEHAEAQLAQSGSDLAAATAAVATARAEVNRTQALFDEAVKNGRRVQALVQRGTLSAADGDHAEAQRETAGAALQAALTELQQAIDRRGEDGAGNAQTRIALTQVARARLNLSYTQVRAPVAGVVSNLQLRPGSTIAAGQVLFALVDTSQWWVDTNFKETDLHAIRVGQPARVAVDMLPGTALRGEVQSIGPASGAAFSLLPPENATGNWVKVTQRFPVRVRLTAPAAALRIGASCTVTIDTRVKAHSPPGGPDG